jgi:hypothetical protein
MGQNDHIWVKMTIFGSYLGYGPGNRGFGPHSCLDGHFGPKVVKKGSFLDPKMGQNRPILGHFGPILGHFGPPFWVPF